MKNLRDIFPYIRPYYRFIFGALALTITVTMLGLAPPLVMRAIIDRVLTEGVWMLLVPLVVAHMLIPLTSRLISLANTIVLSYVGNRLVFDVRTAMYRHIMRLSMRFHGDMSSGAVMSRLMSDVNVVQALVTGSTITLVTDVVVFVFAAVVTFTLSWKLALIAWILLPLYVLNYKHYVKRIRRSNVRYRKVADRIAGNLQERISGTRRVRSFVREDAETEDFLTDTQESLEHAMSGRVRSVTFSTASRLIWGIGSSLMYVLGSYFVLTGEMTYGSVTAFIAYAGQIFGPTIRFTQLANQLEQTMVSVERIFEVLNEHPDVEEKDDAQIMPDGKGHIVFDDVTFGYKADEPVLHDLSLDIPPGTMVAIVGHTGCGKTTITSLVMRLWDVQKGSISIDGKDIRDVTLQSLRKQVGVVLQDPVLFSTTMADNIRYGVPNATIEQVVEAAKAAEIHTTIENLPDGYDTELGGDSGIKLSVGEKQRMAIARAIITNPGVLILDEATSSLDTESELLIQAALERVMQDRTSMVVAHRLSTIVEADLIVVMDQGRILEKGSHVELVRAGGHYANLYNKQHGDPDVVDASTSEQSDPEATPA
jgi:ABC-type multidrug transport system fused ATPase/permease subunit